MPPSLEAIPHRVPRVAVALSSIATACLPLNACSYMEAVMNRKGHPDQRVQLGQDSGTLFITRQEIPNYTCGEVWLFKCDRSGTLYACGCTPRR